MTAGAGPRPGEKEARKHPRKQLELAVSIGDASQRTDTRIRATASNLASGGAFVKCDLWFDLGELIALTLELPGGARLALRGKVIHVQRSKSAGMGIAFTQVSEAHQRALDEYLTAAP